MGEKVIIANNVFAQDGVSIYGTPSGEVVGTCSLTDEEIIEGTIVSYVKEIEENQYGLPKPHSLKKGSLIEVLTKIQSNLLLISQDKDRFVRTLNENLAEITTECNLRKKELKENSELMDLFPRGEKNGPDYQNLKEQKVYIQLALDKLRNKSNKIKEFKEKVVSSTETEISNALKSIEKILLNIINWDKEYVPFAGYTGGKKVEKLLAWQWERSFVAQTRCGLLSQRDVNKEEADE